MIKTILYKTGSLINNVDIFWSKESDLLIISGIIKQQVEFLGHIIRKKRVQWLVSTGITKTNSNCFKLLCKKF